MTGRSVWSTAARVLLAASLLPACSGGGAASDPGGSGASGVSGELLAADRAFARATAERGAEGWASYFLEDGEMMAPGVRIRGRAAILGAMREAFARPGYRIEWTPEEAHPGPSGDTGHTTGRYRTWGEGPAGPTVRDSGRYVTLWHRDGRGRWRVRLDIGLPSSGGG